jgi:hypothetical protein
VRRTPSVSAAITLCALPLLFASCAQNQKTGTDANANAIVFSSVPPFETKEPQSYRATRTITTVNANAQTITKTSIARDGELRREESESNSQKVVYLTRPEGRFIILPDEKLFAEAEAENNDEEPSETSLAAHRTGHTRLPEARH